MSALLQTARLRGGEKPIPEVSILAMGLRTMMDRWNIVPLVAVPEEASLANKALEQLLTKIGEDSRKKLRVVLTMPATDMGGLLFEGEKLSPQVTASKWAVANTIDINSCTPHRMPSPIQTDPWEVPDRVLDCYHWWHSCAFGIMQLRDTHPEDRLLVVTTGWSGSERGIRWSLNYKQSLEQQQRIRTGKIGGYIPQKPVAGVTVYLGTQRPYAPSENRYATYQHSPLCR